MKDGQINGNPERFVMFGIIAGGAPACGHWDSQIPATSAEVNQPPAIT